MNDDFVQKVDKEVGKPTALRFHNLLINIVKFQEVFSMELQGDKFFVQIATGDEIWTTRVRPESGQLFVEWRHSTSVSLRDQIRIKVIREDIEIQNIVDKMTELDG
ncbi:hypothetical protein Trydic_g1442 [Trypoxylus dichotomus]